jgi:hypothetical protein
VFDGAGHSQHFWVTGGTLHIAFVNLANGTASQVETNCRPDIWKCAGGSILVQDGGTLVMRSCDVRGGGPGVSEVFGNAYLGGGVYVEGDYSTGDLYNVSFTDLRATFYSALVAVSSTTEEGGVKIRLAGCQFLRNSAVAHVVMIGWAHVRAEFYDCFFANNDGIALTTWGNADSQIKTCIFRENSGSTNSWPGYGGAVVIAPAADAVVSVSDSLFQGNIGSAAFAGGALTMAVGYAHLENVSFIANAALMLDGGSAFNLENGAKVTATNCFALANEASGARAGGFAVSSAVLTVINSECSVSALGSSKLRVALSSFF